MTNSKVEPPDSENLAAALAGCGVELAPEQVDLLDRYRAQLWSWNERLNLTRHTSFDKFVARDVVDSLALERFIESGDRVLDVGTGGGVPGVILAIVRPDLDVMLCESVAKKATAVSAIVDALPTSINSEHARAEELLAKDHFDTLVARAVAPLAKLLRWFKPHWDAFDQLLVVKGKNWLEERRQARELGLLRGLELRRIYSYQTPGTEAESAVLQIRPRDRR